MALFAHRSTSVGCFHHFLEMKAELIYWDPRELVEVVISFAVFCAKLELTVQPSRFTEPVSQHRSATVYLL